MKNTSSVHRGARPRVRAARNLTAGPVRAGFRPAGLALAVAAACLGASSAFGQPAGAQVIQGQAQLQQQGNSLVVTTQNAAGTNRSVINWQSFSVPAGSTTRFDQPSAQSLSINRVVGNDPSAIYGTLSSNGRLVLVNPAGIAVGAGAVVDTAGFTASTLRLSEADALAGRLVFGGDGLGGGSLKVDGSILARSGDVVLIAPNVQVGSQALVQAPGGATILAAGQKVEITERGLEGITLEIQAPTDKAVNLGVLLGDAVGIFAGQLTHSGQIQATAVSVEGGKVQLKAQQYGEILLGSIEGESVNFSVANLSAGGAGTINLASPPGGGAGTLTIASLSGGTPGTITVGSAIGVPSGAITLSDAFVTLAFPDTRTLVVTSPTVAALGTIKLEGLPAGTLVTTAPLLFPERRMLRSANRAVRAFFWALQTLMPRMIGFETCGSGGLNPNLAAGCLGPH
jgi:filamentous hemagglutinin family protein